MFSDVCVTMSWSGRRIVLRTEDTVAEKAWSLSLVHVHDMILICHSGVNGMS